jgi:hypothetical protein
MLLNLHDEGFRLIFYGRGSKRPTKTDWGDRVYTREEIARIAPSVPNEASVGIILGPKSGMIDIECDGPAAEGELDQLFQGEIPSGARWESKRGFHLPFQWDDRLDAIGLSSTYWSTTHALEIRLGAGGKSAQSRIPPSNGMQWTVPLSRATLPKLPDVVIDRLLARLTKQRSKAKQRNKIVKLLDALGFPYECQPRLNKGWDDDVVYQFTTCPFCHQSGGNPGVFSVDGKAHFYCFEDCPSGTGYTLDEFLEAAERAKPWITKGADFDTKFQRMPEEIIRGLAYKGEVLTVVGGSKTRKTYFVYQLILSIAFGLEWLGYDTTPGRILIIDNELLRPSIRRRLRRVAKALGLDANKIFDHIDIAALRDNPMDVEKLLDRIRDIGPDMYSAIVLDSLYKAYPDGVDENSNSGMTRVFRALGQIGQSADALVIVSHHFSKGSQQGRAIADLGSGAGAQSRSTDCHLTLRPHKEKGHLIVEFIVREFAPPDQGFVIRDAFPLWELAPDKNPNDKLVTAEHSNLTLDTVVSMLKCPTPYTDFASLVRSTLGGTKEAVKLVINEAITRQLIKDEPSRGRIPRMLSPVGELPKHVKQAMKLPLDLSSLPACGQPHHV